MIVDQELILRTGQYIQAKYRYAIDVSFFQSLFKEKENPGVETNL